MCRLSASENLLSRFTLSPLWVRHARLFARLVEPETGRVFKCGLQLHPVRLGASGELVEDVRVNATTEHHLFLPVHRFSSGGRTQKRRPRCSRVAALVLRPTGLA